MRRLSFVEFALVLLQLGVVLLVGWGFQRYGEEEEAVEVTRQRMEVIAEAWRVNPFVRDLPELSRRCNLPEEILEDYWGNRMKYDETEQIVYSNGADGIAGGNGFATDLRQRVAVNRQSVDLGVDGGRVGAADQNVANERNRLHQGSK